MRKLLKSLKALVVVVVVVAIAAIVAVKLFAGGAVRMAVETAGTKALSVGVELDGAGLSLLGSSVSLRDLTVANPAGYQHNTLLKLSRGDIEVQTRSLLTHEVLIRDMQLDGMDLVLEQRGLGNNLQDIIKAAKRKSEPSGKRLYVDNLELKNVTVNVKLLPLPGKADTMTLKLAPIKMTDLGRNEKLDVTALTSKIILAVAGGIAEQGADELPKEMISGLTTVLDTALDLGKVILDTGAGEGIQKGVEDIGKGVTEGLKGILKPKGDD